MNYQADVFSRSYTVENLPPRNVKKSVKESDSWKESIMDAFEYIAIDQFHENLQFVDLYRMSEGKLSYQELSDVAPHLEDIQDLLDGVGIPSFLRHYDLIGIIINALVGQYLNFRGKFHVTDTGEIAMNEFLRHKNEEARDLLKGIIKNETDLALAKAGIDPQGFRKYENPEEQQQAIQQIEEARKQFTPEDTFRATSKTFKTLGVQWGEATIEQDKERFNFVKLEKEELKDFLLTGRAFRHFHIGFDHYKPETWSPKNTFYSKEIEAEFVQDCEYVGRLHFYTPSEVVERWHHLISANKQKELLGGNKDWRNFVGTGTHSGSIESAITNNFNKQARVPFSNFFDYKFYLAMEDDLGVPMGIETMFNDDGTTSQRERYLPRLQGDHAGRYTGYANILKDDIEHRKDLCQVTEAYFIAYDLWGYLTYEDEYGMVVTEEVTEDILPEFLKENNIKQKFTERLVDVVDAFVPGELVWQWRPVSYHGIKVQSENLKEPLYLKVEACENQIQGDSEFDIKLPVAGRIGKGIGNKLEPYQAKYNLAMNQIYSLMEKELGVFFLLDTALIPSEYDDWGDAEEAMLALRNIAKSIGIMPVTTSGDAQKNENAFNQFSSYNLTNSSQIRDRITIAEVSKRNAFEVIGIKPAATEQPNKYETATGVKLSQEASYSQTADLYEEYNLHVKSTLEMHLAVAKHCHSNMKDNSMYYTKSDGSVAFLRITDPNLPLRKIGLMPTQDSTKRKELEDFKNFLLNTNTLGSDTLEYASLFASDDMSEMVEIAKESLARREKAEQDKYQRDQSLIQQQTEGARQVEAEKDARAEASKDKDRETKIEVATINALGRAADKQSDTRGFEEIKDTSKDALDTEKFEYQKEKDKKEFRRQEVRDEENKSKIEKEFTLRLKELDEKVKQRESAEKIAAMNKN